MRGLSIGLMVFAILAVLLIILLLGLQYLSDWQERAAFGSFFGIATALFSGLAFAFFLASYFAQRDQIRKAQETIEANAQSALADRYLVTASLLLEHYHRELAELESRHASGPLGAQRQRKIDILSGKIEEIETVLDGKLSSVLKSLGDS